MARSVHNRVARDPGVEVILIGQVAIGEGGVIIQLAAEQDLPRSYADELRAIVRKEMNDDEVTVYVVALRGQWLSDADQVHETIE